ncbi:S1C family serine protease [Rathayibacter toxicus]|uniref:PDZ domain-containing protein n=1 Tax=Rathayibacter toxicus TaxID=145458 RepID=A0A2S5Y9D3_9MICO|nr:trypsin-like peptidase domain-containing protein [Rathayibacter toxicus]PPH25089.1 PDZ domain-containing protein [Rathayibacter toxicus]PPH59016.1 PDZ domain-containing protein [Rathayibacter toxicus]PPH61009.1 PDZ domain-containing protein [Rathayibacter toxicus]PPH88830.1 PDZ domain-containing protein [Rathayibacter toxicus]PPI16521.1 PDZ domain-containing protein [Rathayibacter toxicus]
MTESHEGPRQPEEPTTSTPSQTGPFPETEHPTTPYPTEPLVGSSQPPYTPNSSAGNEAQAVASADRRSQYAPPAADTLHGAEQPSRSSAFGPGAGHSSSEASTSAAGKRRVGVGVVAALAIGAVVGGVAGAGVFGLWSAANGSGTGVVSAGGAQTITVNNADNATVATAVAAKATPSVVTIAVSGGSSAGTGSGIVLSQDGYVLTNTHVVTLDGQVSKGSVSVTTSDGRIYAATVVGTDPTLDLAVIKLTGANGLTPITFADSSKVNVGDRAVAIGAPLGLSGTVTDGIVSALNRSIDVASSEAPKDSGDSSSGGSESPFNFDLPGKQQPTQAKSSISLPVIQTDAAINPGNSGGALLDSEGGLIGVNVAIASAGQSSSSSGQSGNIGVGFAIPSAVAQRISKDIVASGSASHGLLGASVTDSTQDVLGAKIREVTAGGPAQAAGLAAGDILTNIAGAPVTSASDLTAQVRAQAANSKVDLTYVRDAKTVKVQVTLGQMASH